jgi:hypothetical protein
MAEDRDEVYAEFGDRVNMTAIDHMRRVSGYVGRHLAERPARDVEESAWRYSLMNWGHDPLK